MMEGCYKQFSKEDCDSSERGRLKQNLDQARSQHNYTEVGFKKLRVPPSAWQALKSFWDTNKDKAIEEKMSKAYTFINNWESPTFMVSVEDPRLVGAGEELKQAIWDGVKPVLEEWVGRKIVPTSLYGIRIYKEKAVLATHVDRLPLVTSCIINVDQDVNEDWPIEVYDHAGRAHNVTMKPGDMVLYESSTVLHGRPAPLNGKFYANIFVHFEPIDHKEMNRKDGLSGPYADGAEDEDMDDLVDDLYTPLHRAAAIGNVNHARFLLEENEELLHATDKNLWTPLHEAARGGHLDLLKFFIEKGGNVHARTAGGATVLWWAKKYLDEGHPVIKYLEEVGVTHDGGEL